MTDHDEAELLIELAKLLRKYGPQPFETISHALSDPSKTQELSSLLMGLAQISRSIPTRQKSEKSKGNRPAKAGLLQSIKTSDPTKYEILRAFHAELLNRTLLPTLRDLRFFASQCGLPELRGSSRQKAVAPLIEALSTLPMEEVNMRIRSIKESKQDEQELAGWSRLILDRQRQMKSG